MKYCPTCQTEFDEEVILFCTKDGTPLVEKEQPVFTDKMPSESSDQDHEDDEGAQTIIRRKPPVSGTEPLTPREDVEADKTGESKRIVIPAAGDNPGQAVRPKKPQHRRVEEPKSSNTAIVVLLTIIATVLILLGVFTVYWFLAGGGGPEDNSNLSVNENIDLNENLDNTNFNLEDLNLNANANFDSNFNLNSNSNFNFSTPTPTKTPTPTPSPTPTDTPDNSNTGNTSPSPRPTLTIRPTASPTPARTPTPSTNTNRPVNVGTINGRALQLPVPAYPSSARDARAAGRVVVNVTIDEQGNVIAAKAVNGHPLLRSPAEDAARRSKFRPVSVDGQAVAANGTIHYNFVN